MALLTRQSCIRKATNPITVISSPLSPFLTSFDSEIEAYQS
jgi:hypothetical protein